MWSALATIPAVPAPRATTTDRRTPFAAVLALTFLASLGTGVVWLGIPFIVKHDYGYDQEQTLQLFIVTGFTYVAGAMLSGRLLRWLKQVLSPRGAIGWILLGQSIICAIPLFVSTEIDPSGVSIWVIAAVASFLAALFWPIMESYVAAGRHGAAMRSAIGWFNLVWTASVPLSLLLMAPLVENAMGRMSLVLVGGINLLTLLLLLRFRREPLPHLEEDAQQAVQSEYSELLGAARILLPVAYLLMAGLAPLLPYLFGRLGVEARWETPIAAIWTITRIAGMFFMWRAHVWHGRWGALLFAGATLALGFALIVLASTLAMMIAGLVLFGMGQAVIYYAALYYGMAVGRAAVDAAGAHEARIGLGYGIGPLIVLAGLALPGSLELDWSEATGVVLLVWVAMAVGGVPAIRPYFRARAKRKDD